MRGSPRQPEGGEGGARPGEWSLRLHESGADGSPRNRPFDHLGADGWPRAPCLRRSGADGLPRFVRLPQTGAPGRPRRVPCPTRPVDGWRRFVRRGTRGSNRPTCAPNRPTPGAGRVRIGSNRPPRGSCGARIGRTVPPQAIAELRNVMNSRLPRASAPASRRRSDDRSGLCRGGRDRFATPGRLFSRVESSAIGQAHDRRRRCAVSPGASPPALRAGGR